MPLVRAGPLTPTDTRGSPTGPSRCPLYIAFPIQAPHSVESGSAKRRAPAPFAFSDGLKRAGHSDPRGGRSVPSKPLGRLQQAPAVGGCGGQGSASEIGRAHV